MPQRTCLSPFLFVYSNDITREVKSLTTSMYANNTSLYFKSKELAKINETSNEGLSHLDTWLISNKLSLNVART